MAGQLWRLSASETAWLVKRKRISATDVARSVLQRLEQVNPAINAIVEHRPDDVLAQAARIDARIAQGEDPGVLAGVPVTTKVIADQQGYATTNGLRLQKDLVATTDNPVVANLRKAGAILVGRTNTPAFSLRWFTDNQLHGTTYNPHNRALTPGGSSGGAAAAVAAGIGAVGHGTDIGGSVRYPAYACGVHGLRPTLGRIPSHNESGAERAIGAQLMAVAGPIARTIEDVRLSLVAMSAPDPRDVWHVPVPLHGPPAPKRVALCVRPDGMVVVPEVEAALRDAAQRLECAGWVVEEVPIPSLREAAQLQAMLWIGDPYGSFAEAARRENDPAANAVLAAMDGLWPVPDLRGFATGLAKRATLLREWSLFLENWPVVLMPVCGELPFVAGEDQKGTEVFKRILEAQLPQVGLPLLGLPGLTVATGMVGDAPVGVQVVAGRYREDLCLGAGEAIEAGGTPPSPIDPR